MNDRSSRQPRKGSSPRRQGGRPTGSKSGGRSGGSGDGGRSGSGGSGRSRGSDGSGRSGSSSGRGRSADGRGAGSDRGTSRNSGGSRSAGSDRGKPRDGSNRSGGSTDRGGTRRGGDSRRDAQRQGDRSTSPSRGQREQLRTAGSGGGDLPNWIKEEVARVTSKEKRPIVLALLSDASDAFAEGRYPRAHQILLRAKKETTRVATIRELLGLTAYRMSRWDEALKELRTYRRIDGDTSHMPVEMDCQRALNRTHDVEKTWERYHEIGGRSATDAEMKVVYASFLLDEGRAKEAWQVINPGRITENAREWDLRQWFVAARVALALGDEDTARQLVKAIDDQEAGFPGLEEIQSQLGSLSD